VRPDFAEVLKLPNAHLHWYGKEPKPKRKVGHVTLTADTAEACAELAGRYQRLDLVM
jgi:5-(carboxyamino)imidazole ribonucleotide synthase